jgi:hypothetical protein
MLDEPLLPVRPPMAAACELLGIGPLYVANEGELIIVVPPDHPHDALAALRAHPHGGDAVRIGEIHPDPAGIVVLRTPMSGTRMVDPLVGDPLPPYLLSRYRPSVTLKCLGVRPYKSAKSMRTVVINIRSIAYTHRSDA